MTVFFIIFLFTLGLVPFVYLTNTKVSQVERIPVQEVVTQDFSYTNWVASDGSEMVFAANTFYWYKSSTDHNDNYYFGKYEIYIGSDAVDFITTDLSNYGVTRSELESVFAKNEEYSEDNFIVVNLNYSKMVINGETSVPETTLVPWYGFILDDGTILDVANMNTGTYYKFTKN